MLENNIIGGNFSELERRVYWKILSNYKGSYKLLKDEPGEWKKRIAKRDKQMYHTHLTNFVRAA